ncbi:tetratricopeptide repeat protein 12-like isoform X2 [Halichondria panicea]|uniref:tetratricopeptide repeat protein 12-like isoform X2 n=1 Tax=Halichondria panicea TaxID=6063 RepID=UPI00312B74CD
MKLVHGDLVKGLSTSNDKTAADEAIKKADAYLHVSKVSESTIGFNQTFVNTPTTESTQAQSSQQELCRSLEEDAQERTERRREREAAGRKWKSKGAGAFKRGDMEEALDCYSKALEETPWVITLYTNRALCYNKMGRYIEAIEDCDEAIKIEPAKIRAHVHKGKALVGMGNYTQAIESYQEALKLKPETKLRSEIQAELDSAYATSNIQ